MRKYRNISSILLLLILIAAACETEELIFEGPYFVRFTEPTITMKESHIPVVKIEVHNAGPAAKRDLTVNYTISGSAREGTDYVINGTRGVLKIKSSQYFGYIELQLINNSNNILRSQDVILTLQTINDNEEKIRIGQGVSQIGQVCTLTIQDDCILGGDYYGRETPTSVPVEDITITSLDCKNYTLSNWDISYTGVPIFERDLTFIDNGDNTLTIPRQLDDTISDDEDTAGRENAIEGQGVVNPATRVITFTVRFVETQDKESFTFDLIPN